MWSVAEKREGGRHRGAWEGQERWPLCFSTGGVFPLPPLGPTFFFPLISQVLHSLLVPRVISN